MPMTGHLADNVLHFARVLREAGLAQAQALAVCNAVRGILAVRQMDAQVFASGAAIDPLRAALAQAHPAFATELQ